MRYYREIKRGEKLKAGDELYTDHEWVPVLSEWYGLEPNTPSRYRRPVDLPTLQRVTPEAMAELEGQSCYVTFFKHSRSVRCVYAPALKCWWDDENIVKINPLEWDWFIHLSTIPEVQQ